MKTLFNSEYLYSDILSVLDKNIKNKNDDFSDLQKLLGSFHDEKFYINFSTCGRASLYKILESLPLRKNYKVALQAFTCSVVPKTIIDSNGIPIFIDIEHQSLSMDKKSLIKKINEIDVIILQFTFGIKPKYFADIINLAKEYSKYIILDKAHCIPESIPKEIKRIEMQVDGIFYSTDHTKAINAVRGGISLSKRRLIENQEIKSINIDLPFIYESLFYIEILYPFARIISRIMRIMKIFYMPNDDDNVKLLSTKVIKGSWHRLVINQINNSKKRKEKIDHFTNKLIKIIHSNNNLFINQEIDHSNSLLRLPIICKNIYVKTKLIELMKKNKVLLSDWFGGVLNCNKDLYDIYNYKINECPVAEELSSLVIGIPCNRRYRDPIFLKKFQKVCNEINNI